MHTEKIRKLFLIVCLGCLFLCSCGLDEYYVIDRPSATEVDISLEDTTLMYYQVTPATSSGVASSQINMKGTAVYYKIVSADEGEALKTELSDIKSANTEYSDNAFRKKIENIYSKMVFSSGNNTMEYLNPAIYPGSWKFELKEDISIDEATLDIKLLTVTNGTNSFSVNVTGPTTPGDYLMNAYAVTVGEVDLTPHYSALAPLGVLKFTID